MSRSLDGKKTRQVMSTLSLLRKVTIFVVVITALVVMIYTSRPLDKWRPAHMKSWPVQKVDDLWTDDSLNCTLLFQGDKKEIQRFKEKNKMWKGSPDSELYHNAEKCDWIRKELEGNFLTSEEELQFPLAFAINVYNAPQQVFRFLKIIYRPHNVYCIHYDRKSDKRFRQLIINISNCMPNVIVPQKIEDVVWGWRTIVDAQMNCIEDLYEARSKHPWKYVMTLCGKEVPMRTNLEMVHSLSKLNGTSAVEVIDVLKREYIFWDFKHILQNYKVIRTKEKLGPVPFNLKMQKSMEYYGLTESFVDFLLHDHVAIEFRKFIDDTLIPDEHFVPSLFMKTGVPGGFDKKYASMIPTVDGYIWLDDPKKPRKCNGRNVHGICVVNSEDMYQLDYKPDLHSGHETFFHNKFFMKWDHNILNCFEEELMQRNQREHDIATANTISNSACIIQLKLLLYVAVVSFSLNFALL